MTTSCLQCRTGFEVTEEDIAFLKRLSPIIGGQEFPLPEPTMCPDCREQRRLAVANQLTLFKGVCSVSGDTVVTNIHPQSPYTIIRQDLWYSDAWDPESYGRSIDFSRPFFEQWHELSIAVPRPSLFTGYQYDENSDYTNHSGKNKNCYMIFDSDENRDCYYSYSINSCRDCMECFRVRKSELCYGCIDAIQCYNSGFLQDCENCTDSMYLKNCVGCKNSLMCSNLRNKENYIENKPATAEEVQRVRTMLQTRAALAGAEKRFTALVLEYPQKYMHGVQNESVLGDYLTNCKNAYTCFDSSDLWDCRYVYQAFMALKDSMDIQECGEGEKMYECAFVGYGANTVHFSTHILGDSSDVLYSSYCPHSKNLFGCIGMRHKQYCILNKQYTKEEYETLVPKLIKHMRNTPLRLPDGSYAGQEWGEFFPMQYSYAAYNETLAQDYYPLTKEEATARGYIWRDADPTESRPATKDIPDGINEVPDDITHELFACDSCRKNFRIIPQELSLYRRFSLPLPTACFSCRLAAKRALRNPRKLWNRECAKCQKEIATSYSPERPEIVVCEECYLKEMY